jgi:uncharacterized integral membrane protein (TIGR00697 family)
MFFPLDSEPLITCLQSLAPEFIGIMAFVFCASAILALQRYFGAIGLCAYNSIAVVAANLHALKVGQFALFESPVALGTVVFASSFLATDLLTEYYGKELANKTIWISFATTLVWLGLLLFVLGISPVPGSSQAHEAIQTLFSPSPAIVAASLSAFLLSQKTDVFIFEWVKKRTGSSALWLRASLSMSISALIDTVVFSTLAWVLFAPVPVNLKTLIYTYILGTFVFRLFALLANVGVMYLARRVIPKNKADKSYV